MTIPKIIWQTYKTDFKDLPQYAKDAVKTWKDLNPDYEYRYMSDLDAENFISKEYGEEWLNIFKNVPVAVMRGDIWRYLIIYKYGGIYTDLDTVCLSPISSWMKKDKNIIVAPEFNTMFCQWTFAASKENLIIKSVIERMKNGFINPDYTKPHFVHRLTGPWVWTKGIFDELQIKSELIKEEYNLINSLPQAIKNKFYCYGGELSDIFNGIHVKHLYGSKSWSDGSYEQWTENPLTKDYINNVDIFLEFLKERDQ